MKINKGDFVAYPSIGSADVYPNRIYVVINTRKQYTLRNLLEPSLIIKIEKDSRSYKKIEKEIIEELIEENIAI